MKPIGRYGHHRDEDMPTTVTVLGCGKFPQPMDVPFPPAFVRQRRQINDLASRGYVR